MKEFIGVAVQEIFIRFPAFPAEEAGAATFRGEAVRSAFNLFILSNFSGESFTSCSVLDTGKAVKNNKINIKRVHVLFILK